MAKSHISKRASGASDHLTFISYMKAVSARSTKESTAKDQTTDVLLENNACLS